MPDLIRYEAYKGPRGELQNLGKNAAIFMFCFVFGRLGNIWLTKRKEARRA